MLRKCLLLPLVLVCLMASLSAGEWEWKWGDDLPPLQRLENSSAFREINTATLKVI